MARYVAKNIVAAGLQGDARAARLRHRVAEPVSVMINTQGRANR
jgi:S-adenosylmethionine synthetase